MKARTIIETGTRPAASPGSSSVHDLLRFERLMSDLSATFINLPADRIDDVIQDGLRRVVETLGIDRSSLTRVAPDSGQLHTTHSWAAAGALRLRTTAWPQDAFSWLLAQGRAGKTVAFSSLDELPPEAGAEKLAYRGIGIRSHVAQPLFVAGDLIGFLGFGCLQQERTWPADLVARMRALADIFASALARKRAQEQVQEGSARLDAIVRSAMDAIITVDADQRIVLMNAAAETMFACGASAAIGAPLDRFIPERLCTAHRAHVERFLHTGETSRQMGRPAALRALRTDGTEFPIEASISQATIGGQRLLTVILRDITERTNAARQVDEALRFERLMAELSTGFIDLPPERFDTAIDDALRRIVETLGIDRSTLVLTEPSTGDSEITHSFAVEGVEPVPRNVPLRESLPWAYETVRAGRMVVFSRLDELPAEASVDRETYRRLGQTSHVTVPLSAAGEWLGALTFGCVRRERTWPHDLLGRFRLVAQIFANAIVRKRVQEELARTLGFERLATRILAALLLTGSDEEEDAIEPALREIAQFVGVERATLWERTPGRSEFRKTHRWLAEGVPVPADRHGVIKVTWISARLLAGEVVRLASLAELPPEADDDRRALQALGVRSFLAVPLSASGEVVGALSMSAAQQEREWSEGLIPGLRLLAEVFASQHLHRIAERQRRVAEADAAQWRERLAHLARVHTVGEMSAAIAHEITQPLGAIENYARAAVRRTSASSPDLAKVTELLEKVIGQATRAGDIVMRLRGLVKRSDLDPVRLDIERTIGACVDMVKMDCELHDIRIDVKPAQGLPKVVADEIHIQQVIINLLRNALDALAHAPSGPARTIRIETQMSGPDAVVVRVSDRGTGIPDGDLERVFESFYSTKAGGLGIGLAICRKLIEAHGGALWASQNPGGGTVFEFTLPVSAPQGRES